MWKSYWRGLWPFQVRNIGPLLLTRRFGIALIKIETDSAFEVVSGRIRKVLVDPAGLRVDLHYDQPVSLSIDR